MRIEVVTLFPQLVEAGLTAGILGRAVGSRRLEVGMENPRSHTTDPHRSVDDRPFGGGPGMVLKAEPLAQAIRAAAARLPEGAPMIGLSAHGEPFTQAVARRLAAAAGFGLVAGRYEGIDQRVADALIDEELSIGDYVLSGGELPALIVIDAVTRLLPGVLGNEDSASQESHGDGLLDWPQYTRPEVWDGRQVPDVLLGGNHAAIRRWRLMQALGRTWRLRPDLLRSRRLTPEERSLLEEYCAAAAIEPPR
ncbi:MAG: tRNA (guanosine(37)-N1)-methyltransferase TrmD [Steroidobacteraceae bacterium]